MPQKKVNMKGLRQAVRNRLNSFIRQVVGPEFLTKKERAELPKWDEAVPSFVERVFFMGRVQAILKDREYKTISLERIDQIITTYPLSDVERKVFEDVKAHVGANIKEFTAKVERDVIHAVSAKDAEQLMDAVARDVLRHEIAEGLLGAQHYAEVAVKLAAKLPEVYGKDWTLIARTEMHGAKQRGHAAAILAGAGPYATLGGPDSRVSIVTEPTRCKDCQRLYENGDGSFKIFKLSDLLGNGTNATRKHSKVKGIHIHWVPVVPPAHPRCFCKVKFVPPGYDWVGRSLVKVTDDLQKAIDASASAVPSSAPSQQGPSVPVWYLPVGQHPVRPVNAVHQTKSGKSWAIPIGTAAKMPDGTEVDQSQGSTEEGEQATSAPNKPDPKAISADPTDPFAASSGGGESAPTKAATEKPSPVQQPSSNEEPVAAPSTERRAEQPAQNESDVEPHAVWMGSNPAEVGWGRPEEGHNSRWSRQDGLPMTISPVEAEALYSADAAEVLTALKPLEYDEAVHAQRTLKVHVGSKFLIDRGDEVKEWATSKPYGERMMDLMYGVFDGSSEIVGDGTNVTDTFLARIRDNGDVIAKPSASGATTSAPFTQPHDGAAVREAAAHRMSVFLGLGNLVPETVARDMDAQSKRGYDMGKRKVSMQHFLHNSDGFFKWYKKQPIALGGLYRTYVDRGKVGTPETRANACKDLAVFQLVIGCVDAHNQNILVREDGTLAAIDNSCSFGSGFYDSKVSLMGSIKHGGSDLTITDEMKNKLETLDYGQLKEFFADSGIEDWAVANVYLRAKYLLHLQEKEGLIDYNKFRPVSWNNPVKGTWNEFKDDGHHEYRARMQLGLTPAGLFNSFAKKWILDNMKDESSPDRAVAEEFYKNRVLMPTTAHKADKAARKEAILTGRSPAYDIANVTDEEREEHWDSINPLDPTEALPSGQDSVLGDFMLTRYQGKDWDDKMIEAMNAKAQWNIA